MSSILWVGPRPGLDSGPIRDTTLRVLILEGVTFLGVWVSWYGMTLTARESLRPA